MIFNYGWDGAITGDVVVISMLVALKLIRTEIPILKIIITKNRIELEGDKLVGCFH